MKDDFLEDINIESKILIGDALDKLKEIPDESINCCVTSPPYYGLRVYCQELVKLKDNVPEWVKDTLKKQNIKSWIVNEH